MKLLSSSINRQQQNELSVRKNKIIEKVEHMVSKYKIRMFYNFFSEIKQL
jgi:hypothetical protein